MLPYVHHTESLTVLLKFGTQMIYAYLKVFNHICKFWIQANERMENWRASNNIVTVKSTICTSDPTTVYLSDTILNKSFSASLLTAEGYTCSTRS